jgi:N-acetylmuramoyl-L-alanine amidase/LAGLIDADG-like domain
MALLSFRGSPHGGSHKLLPEWNLQPRITPTTIIDHSIVGSALGAWYYFRDQTGIESHFIVRGAPSGSADGQIWQLMDTGRQADANLDANAFAISIETEDNGDPDDFPWSRAQLESLRWLHAKLRAVHPTIPRRRCPSPRGGGLGYHTMWGAPSAWTPVAGKLLALDTLVPTPDGLLALCEIRVGATVFDERGEPCKVTATYDDLPERAWRIMFDDGLEVLAGGEHQWVTITRGQRKGYFRRDRPRDRHRGPRPDAYPLDWARWGKVRNTDEIASGILASDGAYQHTIPVACRLRLGERELAVDPYLLGVWLGDGGERDGVITAGFDPDDLMASDAEFIARQFIRAGYELGAWQPRYGHRTLTLRALGFERQLRELGVLGNKHAPQDYLVASADQRLALLQGLMDTDGSNSSGRGVEFTSKSEALADAVVWLASSLGQRVRKSKGEARLRGVSFGPRYRVTWASTVPCFRIPRKAARLHGSGNGSSKRLPSIRSQSRQIVRCEPVPIQPMRCLTVDSPNSMYVITDRCLPTHNTCPGRPVRVRQWEQILLPAFLEQEGNDLGTFEGFSGNGRESFEAAVKHAVDRIMSQGLTGDADGAIRGWARQLDDLHGPSSNTDDVDVRVREQLRAGFGGVHPGATGPQVRASQAFIVATLLDIQAKLDQLLPPPAQTPDQSGETTT